MQMEWNEWLTGVVSFKKEQGVLWIFLIMFFVMMKTEQDKERTKIFIFSQIMAVLVLLPMTAIVLLKVYTPFYDWLDLQGLLPWVLLLGLGSVKLIDILKQVEIPGLRLKEKMHTIISIICVMVLLLAGTGFRALNINQRSDKNGVPLKASEAFGELQERFPERMLIVAAPKDLILYVTLFEEDWQPLYGRDLWSSKAASYINSGYSIEYDYYELLEKQEITEEEAAHLAELVRTGPADCIIIPSSWGYLLEEQRNLLILYLSDSYVGIIKKELITE